MSSDINYQVLHDKRLIAEGRIRTPFTVGRQMDSGEAEPVCVVQIAEGSPQFAQNENVCHKLIMVPLGNRTVPRLALKVDSDDRGNIRVRNIHRAVELQWSGGQALCPQDEVSLGNQGEVCFPDQYQLRLRSAVTPAQTVVAASANDEQQGEYVALDFGPKPADIRATRLLSMIGESALGSRQEMAVRLVRTALEAFKEPPGSKEFFAAAGGAAIKMIDLDRVAVLRKENGEWQCRSISFRPGLDEKLAAARGFSHTLLAGMESNGKTMIIDPQMQQQPLWGSITEVDRAVVAPIFGVNKAIVGALYGDRLLGESENDSPIGELEAALLEVIASGISSSLAVKREQRLRSSMSQFFSPVILSQLKLDQSLLDGRETQVTVLFCDIRGFSSVAEKIGPTKTIEWINDVFTSLSECVLAQDGVLVDYIGDELMAMWGAPGVQPDHAERACRAALDMLTQIVPLQDKWQGVVPNRFGFGIGINSGSASVGNTGSNKKFKYGPIGNTVNVASRVQGITKHIGIPGLVTGETAQAVDRSVFQTRRLAQVRVAGIQNPFDLYQLCEAPSQQDLCDRYEHALAAYEKNDLKTAAGRLASLVQDYPEDRPTIILLSRTVDWLTQRTAREFDPVWHLSEK